MIVKKQAEVCRHYELDWTASDQGQDELMRADADYVVLTAKGDIDHLRTLVPAPLEATSDVTIFMARFKESVRDDVMTWAYPFHEWGVGVTVKLTEPPYTEGLYEIQSYVDDDFALVFGREVWGYPKKMGTMTISPPLSEDASQYDYTVSRRGTQLASVSVANLQPIPDHEFPLNGVGHAICYRQVPSPDEVAIEKCQLVFVKAEYTNATRAQKGEATVTFNDGPFDQMLIGDLTDVTAYVGSVELTHYGVGNLVIDAKELARPLDLSRAGKVPSAHS